MGESAYKPADPEGGSCESIGADLLLDRDLIQTYFPFLSEGVLAALHVRRAGWLSAQQLGMHLLEEARASGVHRLNGKVTGLETASDRVNGVRLQDGTRILIGCFVNAAGPFVKGIGKMLSLDLPIYHELHLKLAIKDAQAVVDRGAPLVIWSDPQKLNWTSEEAAYLDDGYYTGTRENRPLIGPMGVEGAYLIGALSGFGVMAACASGELLASHVTGSALPDYAPGFALERYSNPTNLAQLESLSKSGQL